MDAQTKILFEIKSDTAKLIVNQENIKDQLSQGNKRMEKMQAEIDELQEFKNKQQGLVGGNKNIIGILGGIGGLIALIISWFNR